MLFLVLFPLSLYLFFCKGRATTRDKRLLKFFILKASIYALSFPFVLCVSLLGIFFFVFCKRRLRKGRATEKKSSGPSKRDVVSYLLCEAFIFSFALFLLRKTNKGHYFSFPWPFLCEAFIFSFASGPSKTNKGYSILCAACIPCCAYC